METLKITPIDQIEDLADGVPVLAVEGTVKYAQDLKRGTSPKGVEWTKQFFVLSSGTAEIACSMWDAEGSELAKGETVRIENTQNKKGVWAGMVKGSYQKDGERKHTLEIRASQVKITDKTAQDNATLDQIRNAKQQGYSGEPSQDLGYDPAELQRDWPEATPVKTEPKRPSMLDERQRAIIRQHSQSMAMEVLKLKVALNELTVADLTPSKLKALADYFDNDCLTAAQP
jgi:hypothetical protein